jgi:hypothetical protein
MHELEGGTKKRTLHKNSEECGTHEFKPHPKSKFPLTRPPTDGTVARLRTGAKCGPIGN